MRKEKVSVVGWLAEAELYTLSSECVIVSNVRLSEQVCEAAREIRRVDGSVWKKIQKLRLCANSPHDDGLFHYEFDEDRH